MSKRNKPSGTERIDENGETIQGYTPAQFKKAMELGDMYGVGIGRWAGKREQFQSITRWPYKVPRENLKVEARLYMADYCAVEKAVVNQYHQAEEETIVDFYRRVNDDMEKRIAAAVYSTKGNDNGKTKV